MTQFLREKSHSVSSLGGFQGRLVLDQCNYSSANRPEIVAIAIASETFARVIAHLQSSS
jgi:hypothetical protein